VVECKWFKYCNWTIEIRISIKNIKSHKGQNRAAKSIYFTSHLSRRWPGTSGQRGSHTELVLVLDRFT